MPVALTVEPTTACNLRCPQCPSGLRSFSRPVGRLQPDLFRSVIDQIERHTIYLTLYFQGEPLLHPLFVELVRYADKKGIFTATSTNGHFIDFATAEALVAARLGRLIVSVDGTTQEVYEKYRVGGTLEQVLKGISHLVRAKKQAKSLRPEVVIQFLVGKHNVHQMQDMKKVAAILGADRTMFKTMQVYDQQGAMEFLPEEIQYRRYQADPNGLKVNNLIKNRCWRMWHSCVVTWDGKVVPCCFDKDARYVMGDLNRNSLQQIWFGERYQQFRQKILNSRSAIDICSNCSEGARVWIRA